MARRRRGFTLIELLVVTAIITLLIAILLPSLGRCEQAKTLQCAANMRQMGQLATIYAGSHDGRGPGQGHGTQGNASNAGVAGTGTSFSWGDIINHELLQRPDGTSYSIDMRTGVSPRTLACPDFPQPSPGANREYVYNGDATGDDNNGMPIPCLPQAVCELDSFYTSQYGNTIAPLDSYEYGAHLAAFVPSQFQILEAYAANDTVDSVAGNAKGQITTALSLPGYNVGYAPSFRHAFGKKANFLCFDGHIELLGPKDDVGDHTGATCSYMRLAR